MILEKSEYEPYGLQVNAVGPAKDGPGYTGHVQDGPTGLINMQQRYYDPDSGRFLSVDPITAYGSGDWRHFNVYAYAYNNPYKFIDSDGRCPVCAAVPVILGGATGGLTDYAIQKYFNPDKPINKIELGIAIVAGAVSGGSGGALVGAVARGTARKRGQVHFYASDCRLRGRCAARSGKALGLHLDHVLEGIQTQCVLLLQVQPNFVNSGLRQNFANNGAIGLGSHFDISEAAPESSGVASRWT
jgi:RHS repeat-associated protein